MTIEELKLLIKEEIVDLNFEYLIENYSSLKGTNEFQWAGLSLLKEYSVDLNSAYESFKCGDSSVTGYYFYDSKNKMHLSVLQNTTDIIKIGPSASQNQTSFIINTNKRNDSNKNDPKILSTHINNIFKIIKDNNLKTISFEPADDKYSNVRKRLFIALLRRYNDQIDKIDTKGNWFIIHLK